MHIAQRLVTTLKAFVSIFVVVIEVVDVVASLKHWEKKKQQEETNWFAQKTYIILRFFSLGVFEHFKVAFLFAGNVNRQTEMSFHALLCAKT